MQTKLGCAPLTMPRPAPSMLMYCRTAPPCSWFVAAAEEEAADAGAVWDGALRVRRFSAGMSYESASKFCVRVSCEERGVRRRGGGSAVENERRMGLGRLWCKSCCALRRPGDRGGETGVPEVAAARRGVRGF